MLILTKRKVVLYEIDIDRLISNRRNLYFFKKEVGN